MPAAQNAAGMDGKNATCGAGGKHSKSMHEGVPVWHDCCSCEAEPYWAEMDEAADSGAADDDN
jgi:hypothetical protein